MKKIMILSLCLTLCFGMRAQTAEDYHFSLRDGYVTWQMVYDSPIDSTSVINYLLGSGNFADLAETTNGFSFTILPRSADYQAARVKRGMTAMYLLNYQMTAHGLLQMRDGRYRVTVDHIAFPDGASQTSLETYALNRQADFKALFFSMNAALIIDHELTGLFTIREETDEDW